MDIALSMDTHGVFLLSFYISVNAPRKIDIKLAIGWYTPLMNSLLTVKNMSVFIIVIAMALLFLVLMIAGS